MHISKDAGDYSPMWWLKALLVIIVVHIFWLLTKFQVAVDVDSVDSNLQPRVRLLTLSSSMHMCMCEPWERIKIERLSRW